MTGVKWRLLQFSGRREAFHFFQSQNCSNPYDHYTNGVLNDLEYSRKLIVAVILSNNILAVASPNPLPDISRMHQTNSFYWKRCLCSRSLVLCKVCKLRDVKSVYHVTVWLWAVVTICGYFERGKSTSQRFGTIFNPQNVYYIYQTNKKTK